MLNQRNMLRKSTYIDCSKKQIMHVALGIAVYDRAFWAFQYSVRPLVSQLDLSGEPKLAFRFKWWLSKLHGRLAFLSCPLPIYSLPSNIHIHAGTGVLPLNVPASPRMQT